MLILVAVDTMSCKLLFSKNIEQRNAESILNYILYGPDALFILEELRFFFVQFYQ